MTTCDMRSDTGKFYGALYNAAGETKRRAAFLIDLLGAKPSRIVDTSAGVGDLAFLLAKEGHRVLAFEPCGEMYAVLFDRFSRDHEIRKLVVPFPSTFEVYPLAADADLAISSNQWSHLSHTERSRLLPRLFSGLGPAGILVINCVQETPLRSDQPWAEIHKRVFGDLIIRHFACSEHVPGTASQRVNFEYRMEYLGHPVHTVSATSLLTLDTPEAVGQQLREVGFSRVTIRGSYADADYHGQLQGFVIVAVKPGSA